MGGGLLGSTAEVGIAILNVSGVGLEYCGGAIGKGKNKMCVGMSCVMLSHLANKIVLDTSDHPADWEFIFIQSTTKRPVDTAVVYFKPCILASRLGSRLTRYLLETQTVTAWETLFLHLASAFHSEAKDAEVEVIVTWYKNEEKYGMTPIQNIMKLVVSSPALGAGFEATLMPLNPDLGLDLLFASNVCLGWKPMVSNLKTLATLVMGTDDLVKQLLSVTET
jgi:hypothetical protein